MMGLAYTSRGLADVRDFALYSHHCIQSPRQPNEIVVITILIVQMRK